MYTIFKKKILYSKLNKYVIINNNNKVALLLNEIRYFLLFLFFGMDLSLKFLVMMLSTEKISSGICGFSRIYFFVIPVNRLILGKEYS